MKSIINKNLKFKYVLVLVMLINITKSFFHKPMAIFSSNTMKSKVQCMKMSSSTYMSSPESKIAVTSTESITFLGDLLVIPFYKPSSKVSNTDEKELVQALKDTIPNFSEDLKKIVSDILDEAIFKADVASKQVVRLYGSNVGVKYIALVGLGVNPKKDKSNDLEVKSASRLGKAIASIAQDIKVETVGVVMPANTGNAGMTPFLLAIQDMLYEDNRFKKVPDGGHSVLKWKSLVLLGCTNTITKDTALVSKLTSMIASGVHFTKDLVGAPPSSKTPVAIAEEMKKLATEYNLQIKVLAEAECKELGMGGYLGVQQGSRFPPQFVHLTYKAENPSNDTVKVALVGKGLTFDSGGYNLKSGAGSMIELMKFDMGGCGAVFGTAKAIAQLRPKNLEVHFISAICENMISAEAMRPGDVLIASNGKTIEVLNTDAEGRLTLADALVYAEKLGVDSIIDLATLTGASIVGLGEKIAALYSPDEELLKELQNAAKRTDESLWHMPLEPSYKESIKGKLTDVKNLASQKGGGSITAALFLQEFIDKTPWAHIDMAGPVWIDNKPTGFGVKLLVDYLLNVKKNKKHD